MENRERIKVALAHHRSKRTRAARLRKLRIIMLTSLAATAYLVFAYQDSLLPLVGHGKYLSDRHELSYSGIKMKVTWKQSWQKITKFETTLRWQPIWQKKKYSVWKVEEIPKWTIDHIHGWKVVRRPTLLQVKVPMWTYISIPQMIKVWKPIIKESQILVSREVFIPTWRMFYRPTWRTENIPGEKYLGTDQNGWIYVGHDVTRKKIIWLPVWEKMWNIAQKKELITKKQLEWKEQFQLVVTTKKQPIWIKEKLDYCVVELIPIWKNMGNQVWFPIQKRIWVHVWGLYYYPIFGKVEITSWKKIWTVFLERVNKPYKPERPYMVLKDSGNLPYKS